MKIVQIIENLDIGGAENFLVQLISCQCKTNDVTLILLKSTDPEKSFIRSVNPKIKIIQLNWKKKYSILQLIKLISIINKLRPQIVHVHLHNAYYYVFGASMFLKKSKYVHTMHNSVDVWNPILKITNYLRFLNNSITHVCISKSIYTDMQRKFPHLKSECINNGIEKINASRTEIEINEFWNNYVADMDLKVLSIGNISRYKNYSLLAKTCKELVDELPTLKCIVIGDFPDKHERELLGQINAPNVFFVGSKQNAADYLLNADALIISSLQEGMPIVALEALSLGIPILTTPAGGLIDVVKNNYNGFIAEDMEIESLKKIIYAFIQLSTNERKTLSINAFNSFRQNYNIAEISLKYEKLYQT